ncbi:hypothetical protein HME9304_03025 [Flagellimonas maritima]|uniref:Phosphopeptide-binding protein n=1 Tax=Flagellimonas maritima TaxID=1383885 RepID=A0A2Z4LWE5_9FLAO|nr:hypothetical protein [Allomuricauda aurantiaca]AWX45993.1 hypothetical protein HME9304_03025 [Allomuricauda aurantiaca]
MKMNTPQIFAMLLLFAATISCKQQKKDTVDKKAAEQSLKVADETTNTSIELVKLEGSPAYEDATLELQSLSDGTIAKGGEAKFDFMVSDYELGAQTDGPNAELLANSGKGQHIHFILNNQPYSAHYEPTFSKEIPDGVHHLVAFLSRSYHESVKNENSMVVKKLEVGENPVDSNGLDMDAPTLIYSRPKGEYLGADTKRLLLDFFVLNTTLSEDGNKVRATINGEEFVITEWAPHIIIGLPMGEVIIQLELIDSQGNPIPGPFNKVVRTVTLKS